MIFVTGGTGLVGARLLFDLASHGKYVRALKRPESSLAAFDFWFDNNPQLRSFINWVDGDLTDIDSLQKSLEGITTVYHCAAVISSNPRNSKYMEEVNIQGTANLVNLCLDLPQFEIFCHVSSVAALGREPGSALINEESHWVPGKHNSDYAVSKYGGEREVWRGIAEGLNAVIVNPSVILGPGNWNQGSTELFTRIYKGFPFYSEGISGFVDVRDVTAIMLKLAERKITGQRFIINSENCTYKKVFCGIAEAMHVKKPSVNVKPWMAALAWRLDWLILQFTGKNTFVSKDNARSSQAVNAYDNSKIIKLLDYKFISIDESVRFASDAFLLSLKK